MNPENKQRLAQLLAERVEEKSAVGDTVGMMTTARMLDQVEGELGRPAAATAQPEGAREARARRVFVRG